MAGISVVIVHPDDAVKRKKIAKGGIGGFTPLACHLSTIKKEKSKQKRKRFILLSKNSSDDKKMVRIKGSACPLAYLAKVAEKLDDLNSDLDDLTDLLKKNFDVEWIIIQLGFCRNEIKKFGISSDSYLLKDIYKKIEKLENDKRIIACKEKMEKEE